MSDAAWVFLGALVSSPGVVLILKSLSSRPRPARLPDRVAALETRTTQLETRNRHLDDYIEKLRRHISEGNPPPPPPWPDELTP